jgi:bacterioferritin
MHMPRGDKNVIKHLNVILRNELTAINQYFLHSRMFGHMGYKKLQEQEYKESIDEMKHADMLIQRILFLEGLPNLQDMGKLFIGETPKEMLEADFKIEQIAHKDLLSAIAATETAKDNVTVNLLEDILKSEEEHSNWLRTQLDLMKNLGEELYLQSQI